MNSTSPPFDTTSPNEAQKALRGLGLLSFLDLKNGCSSCCDEKKGGLHMQKSYCSSESRIASNNKASDFTCLTV